MHDCGVMERSRGWLQRTAGKAAAGMAVAGLLCVGGVAHGQLPGYSLEFNDSQNEWVESDQSGLLDGASQATLELWVYVDSTWFDGGSWRNVAGLTSGTGSTSGDDFLFGFHRHSGDDNIALRINGATSGDSAPWAAYENQWVHLAGVYDNGLAQTYVNGELVASFEQDSELDSVGNQLFLSSTSSAYDAGARGFLGRMQEVRLWDVARTPAEIQSTMHDRLAGDESGLITYWPLSEGAGDTVEDLSPNGNNGAINGPEWIVEQLLLTDITSQITSVGQTVTLGPVELFDPQGDVTYQWYFNDEPIDGATEASLTLTDVTTADAGQYHVVIDDDRDATPVESSRVSVDVWENLPVGGVTGLAGLGAVLLAGGAWVVRRKSAVTAGA